MANIIILKFPGYRWIGPLFLIPDEWFSEKCLRLTIQTTISETSLQHLNIAFVFDDVLWTNCLLGLGVRYKPAIRLPKHTLLRIDTLFSKNRLWRKVPNVTLGDDKKIIPMRISRSV